MDKKQRKARKSALKIFEKGTTSRKRLKKALQDRKLSRKELKKVIKGGATKKQVKQLGKTIAETKQLKSKFLRRGEGPARQTAADFYTKITDRVKGRAATDSTDTTDDTLSDISDIIETGETQTETATSELGDLFGGQLDEILSGQQAFREDLKTMFANMMARGAGREGALGVRSARRKPLGQSGTTGQFGREGLRIRSINI